MMKTEDLLQKYVSTGLSSEERFELEKRALEDDFLAEAWEGLQLHQGSNLRQKWNAIQSEWQSKTIEKSTTKVIVMRPWMQYAAAAAILLLGAALFFMRTDESLSDEEGVIALSPIEITDDQEILTASESDESTAVISNLEEREAVEKEKSIQRRVEKIMPLSNTIQKESSNKIVSQKDQSPATAQKSNTVSYDGPEQLELAAIESKNTLVRPATESIPNPESSAEEHAAISVDTKVEDFGNAEIRNITEAPIIAKIETPDGVRQQSDRLFKSKKTNDNESAKLSAFKKEVKLTDLKEDLNSSSLKTSGLKKNTIANSNLAQSTEENQASLQKARDLFLKDKDYEGARDEALRVIALNSNLSEGYELIGDIYSAASYTCDTDEWNQSLAVLAAFDQFSKALFIKANTSNLIELQNKMSALKERFPAKDEGFMRGVKPGDTVQVACWIKETVLVRYKD